MRVLERFTERLITRQREMYGRADLSGIEKWRTAIGSSPDLAAAGANWKIWSSCSVGTSPDIAERVAQVNSEWRAVLTEAFDQMMAEHWADRERFLLAGVVSLVMTFNEGIMVERLSGISTGHSELLEMVERWLQSLEEAKR